MRASDFVLDQLRDFFATTSRMSAELALVRERLVRAEIRIQDLEATFAKCAANEDAASDSCDLKSTDTETIMNAANYQYPRH